MWTCGIHQDPIGKQKHHDYYEMRDYLHGH